MLLTQDPNINPKVRFNAAQTVFSSEDSTEPVSLQEAKDYCKIDTGTTDDTIITYLITTARQQCEDFTGLSIIKRTVTAYVNNTAGGIYLPYGPVKLPLTSIKDKDSADIATGDYTIFGTVFPQLIVPTWDQMTLVYDAGYGQSGLPTLPREIKTAILQQVFYLYENRGDTAIVSRTGVVELTLSPQAKATLQRLRRV